MIDQLVTALNDSDVDFVRDSWTGKPSADYGVVDYASTQTIWADNAMQMQMPTVNVWMYTTDDGDDKAAAVQLILNQFEGQIGWRLVSREYLSDVNMVCWHWQVRLEAM